MVVDFQQSGLDGVRAMMADRPPIPMAQTLGFKLVEVEAGRVVFEGEPDTRFLNPMGSIQGGWAAAILDASTACAVHSMLQPGQSYSTLELKVAYHRALTPGMGLLRSEGRSLSVGRRAGFAEAKLIGPDGKLYASATSTCIVMQPG